MSDDAGVYYGDNYQTMMRDWKQSLESVLGAIEQGYLDDSMGEIVRTCVARRTHLAVHGVVATLASTKSSKPSIPMTNDALNPADNPTGALTSSGRRFTGSAKAPDGRLIALANATDYRSHDVIYNNHHYKRRLVMGTVVRYNNTLVKVIGWGSSNAKLEYLEGPNIGQTGFSAHHNVAPLVFSEVN